MSILSSLLLLIIFARLFGELFKSFNQPSLIGEIIAGILLGPSVFHIVKASPALSGISDLAMFLIILSAGLEMEFKDVIRSFKGKGLVIAFLGFVIPMLVGNLTGLAFGLDKMRIIFLGLCIAITALPVAVRILESFNILNHSIAHYTIATAIVNDIAALFTLGIILNVPDKSSYKEIAHFTGVGMAKLAGFAFIILLINFVFEKADARGMRISRASEMLVKFFGREALLGLVVAFALAFGSIAELLGTHFVIGAFFGALLLDKKLFLANRYKDIESSLASIASGFLSPVFFAYLGLEFDAGSLAKPFFVIVVLAVSMGSKIFAGWWGGKLMKLPEPEPLGIGIILNGRGVMELVVANIALAHGFIGQDLFSTLVLMGVFTTFVTPLLFRKFVAGKLFRPLNADELPPIPHVNEM